MRVVSLFIAFVCAVVAGVAIGKWTTPTASMDKAQVEGIIENYLVANPEVLMRAAQALQGKQQAAQQAQSAQAANQHAEEIFNHSSPFAGETSSSTVVAEFFDYQCGHCQEMQVVLDQFLAANPGVKVVYKELPIFGAESELAAQAALAANLQGHYAEMHAALMKLAKAKALNEESIFKAAAETGLDVEKLKTDMNGPVVQQILEKNLEIAKALGVRGTPTLVIRSPATNNQPKIVFGAVPLTELEKHTK